MNRMRLFLSLSALSILASGCAGEGRLVMTDGVGITAVRSACPAVGIPEYTGDITLFNGSGRTAVDIDLSATLSKVRSTCNDTGERVYSEVSFDVYATRTNTSGERDISIPYFVTVMQGGANVQSKRVGAVKLHFADGAARAQAQGKAGAYVDRAAATLPEDIRERITRKRKAGDDDAAVDPLADPQVREALRAATFELLVGLQMSDDQLAYNVTR